MSDILGRVIMSKIPGDADRFWLLNGTSPTGPFNRDQIVSMLSSGEIIRDAKVCRFGESDWQSLDSVFDASMGSRIAEHPSRHWTQATKAARPKSKDSPAEKPTESWASIIWGAILPILLAIGFFVRQNANQKKAPDQPLPNPVIQQGKNHVAPIALPANAPLLAVGQICVSASDAINALQNMVAAMPRDEVLLLHLEAVLTGIDTYGVRVRIRNEGPVTVRVFPNNLRVRFGPESVSAITTNHPLFLQPCILAPGQAVEGLVMYRATIDVGAVIRLLGTSFTYSDPTIVVRYQ